MRGATRRSPGRGPSSLALLCLLLVVPGGRARAVYECGGVQDTCNCGAANFCICCSDAAHGANHGNCVWYAWHKACCEWSTALQWCTNAEDWDTGAQNNGYPLRTEPCAATIFQCEAYTSQCGSGGYGHVGWVETAYPNGSIDVTEEGCYSWYGVRSRTIQAQNASPTMHYIYKPGTSCSSCDCTPGDVDTTSCPQCGTQSRTCGSDCHWGGWSACQGQGPCESGQQEQQGCPQCGTQTRTCNGSCQWDPWSSCAGQGACEAGTSQPCGQCGGTQTCDSSCQWGACQETCPPDAGSWPDAGAASDAGAAPDAATGSDAQILPTDGGGGADASSPGPDTGGAPDFPTVSGGCSCHQRDTGGGSGSIPGGPLSGFLTFVLWAGWRNRRRRHPQP